MSRSVRLRGGKSIATAGYAHYRCQAGHRDDRPAGGGWHG